MKQCTKCKRFLPETEFYYRKDQQKLRNICIDCIHKQAKQHYQKNRINIIKRVTEYHNRPGIRKKRNEYARQYYRDNREKILEYIKKYMDKRIEYAKNHPEVIRKIQKRFREKYKKEHGKDISSKYYPRYKEKVREKTRQRYLKKKELYEDFTLDDWRQKIKDMENCPNCDRRFSEVHPFCATIDHILPISKAPKGYHYTINDVNPLCGSCNCSKGNKI